VSINSADFPAALWDGLGPNRTSRLENKRPDFEDYDQLAAEVMALQSEFILPFTNSQGTTMIPGQSVYLHTDGTVKLADGDGSGTRGAFGMVLVGAANGGTVYVKVAGVIELTLAQWDAVGTDSNGLDPGVKYLLSDTAGEITATPLATAADTLLTVGFALTATKMLLKYDDTGLVES